MNFILRKSLLVISLFGMLAAAQPAKAGIMNGVTNAVFNKKTLVLTALAGALYGAYSYAKKTARGRALMDRFFKTEDPNPGGHAKDAYGRHLPRSRK